MGGQRKALGKAQFMVKNKGKEGSYNVPFLCRKPGNDSKMLVCETCDKGYHTFCLKPPMEELPAHSWKCKVRVLDLALLF